MMFSNTACELVRLGAARIHGRLFSTTVCQLVAGLVCGK